MKKEIMITTGSNCHPPQSCGRSTMTTFLACLIALSLWFACWAAGVEAGDDAVPAKPAAGPRPELLSQLEWTAGYGYRMDEFNWHIAGSMNGTNPDILSELTWRDLSVHQLRVGMRLQRASGLYLRSHLHCGTIVEGENQDSDFNEDDRQDEYSRSVNQADQGRTWDFSMGLGYPVFSDPDWLSLAPVVGVSHHQQELHMTDGYQVIPARGSFSGLDSSYHARWTGPWLGVDLTLKLEKISRRLRSMSLFAVFEHHWAEYRATADWNLRTDFEHPKSFEHEANGQGDRWMVGLKNRLTRGSTFSIFYEAQRWDTGHGVDRVYLAGGRTVETRLNDADWRSECFGIEFAVRF